MISTDKKNLIRKRLCQGASVTDIVNEVQVSRMTVHRVKKELPPDVIGKSEGNQDDLSTVNISTLLTKEEAKFARKYGKEVDLFEDEEEGWTYHLTKEDYRMKTSGLWWSFIAYPESVPENWIEKLRHTGLRFAISPLHDKDTWNHDSPEAVDAETGEIIPRGARYKAGDPKKAHWHGIVVSDKSMSAKDANAVIRKCTNGPYVQKCRSLRNAYEYFLHINAPEKYQGYDKDDIQCFNNFQLEPNKYETGILQNEILKMMRDQNLTTMDKVVEAYIDQPEYITVLAGKPGIFSSYANALWRKENPEGRVQRVKVITEDDEQ